MLSRQVFSRRTRLGCRFAGLLLVAFACGTQLRAAAEDADTTRTALTPQYTTTFSAAVDKIVTTAILNLKIPSVTVAVAHRGVLLHTGAYGLEHVKPDVVPVPSTVYLLDSMTKQFTAAGIMLLVQDGKLDIDKPVKTYIPYAPRSWDQITVRHLLTHTSGLPHDPQWGYPSVRSQDSNPDRLLKHHIFNQHLKFAPGQRYAYSNTGYATLGAIISKVSGKSYSQFMSERIFQPLEMTSTGIDFSGADVKKGARGYNYVEAKKEWALNADTNQPMAAGAIQSNVLDLAKWDAALNGNSILTAASKAEMWKSYKLKSGHDSDYGFGWATGSVKGQPAIWHNGGGWGFNSGFYRFLDSGLTVIVLTNLEFEPKGMSHADLLAQEIAAAYSPDLDMLSGAAAPAEGVKSVGDGPQRGPTKASDSSGAAHQSDDPKKKKGGGDPVSKNDEGANSNWQSPRERADEASMPGSRRLDPENP